MIDVIEYLSQNHKFMDKFCQNCEAHKYCLADWNPFYEEGCVRERDLKDIEEAVEALEKLIEGVAAA